VLEAHGGADHVLLNVQDGMWWETTPYCEFDYLATALGAATRLAHTGMYGSGEPAWRYPENYLDSSHGTRAYLPQLQASPAFNSIPYPSFVHLDDSDGPLHPSSLPWRSQHTRPRRIVGTFATSRLAARDGHSEFPKPTRQLRKALKWACLRHNSSTCFYKEPCHTGRIMNQSSCLRPVDIALSYRGSTFCLQPGGDNVARKGIVDALLLGCIPVLFHRGQLAQWPWHWGSWASSATVLINETAVRAGELDVVQALLSLSPTVVSAKQRVIASNAHTMQYSLKTARRPRPPSLQGQRPDLAVDAFEIALCGAWRQARDPRRVALGRRMQQAACGKPWAKPWSCVLRP